MANSMTMNITWKPSMRGTETTMDLWYWLVQRRLAEERAHAQEARLAALARRRRGGNATPDGDATADCVAPRTGLRRRLGHALIAAGMAVEGRRAIHPHVPARGSR